MYRIKELLSIIALNPRLALEPIQWYSRRLPDNEVLIHGFRFNDWYQCLSVDWCIEGVCQENKFSSMFTSGSCLVYHTRLEVSYAISGIYQTNTFHLMVIHTRLVLSKACYTKISPQSWLAGTHLWGPSLSSVIPGVCQTSKFTAMG